jgi:hypothetical protein
VQLESALHVRRKELKNLKLGDLKRRARRVAVETNRCPARPRILYNAEQAMFDAEPYQ